AQYSAMPTSISQGCSTPAKPSVARRSRSTISIMPCPKNSANDSKPTSASLKPNISHSTARNPLTNPNKWHPLHQPQQLSLPRVMSRVCDVSHPYTLYRRAPGVAAFVLGPNVQRSARGGHSTPVAGRFRSHSFRVSIPTLDDNTDRTRRRLSRDGDAVRDGR